MGHYFLDTQYTNSPLSHNIKCLAVSVVRISIRSVWPRIQAWAFKTNLPSRIALSRNEVRIILNIFMYKMFLFLQFILHLSTLYHDMCFFALFFLQFVLVYQVHRIQRTCFCQPDAAAQEAAP